MDLKKIFMKDARPTKIGGQAVLNGIMMKSETRTSVAVRLPDDALHIKTEKNPQVSRAAKIPLIRGVFVFIASLVQGTKTLMYSADVLESYEGEDEIEEDRFSMWLEKKLGKQGAWNAMLYMSVIISILFTVGVFVILPTGLVSWMKHFTGNEILLNLAEGVLRIVMFILYIVIIARMKEIKEVFQFHGAEHKCIHCYENGLELTPENCQQFYTLHPRCGTSFLMFVMIISLILFSLLGWPGLIWRIVSRLLLIPVIAGLSYELLRWAGKSDNTVIRAISMPGIWLQKLTTREPTDEQLEVAIAAMEAVAAEEGDYGEGLCDGKGRIIRSGEASAETAGSAADSGSAESAKNGIMSEAADASCSEVQSGGMAKETTGGMAKESDCSRAEEEAAEKDAENL